MIDLLIRSVTGYPGLFLFCVASGLAVPLPEDISLLYAGSRVQAGEMAWAPTLMVAMTGVMLRDLIAWGLGRSLGDWLLAREFVQRAIGANKLARAHALIRNHGSSAVLAGRFLVGLRAPIFLVAGAAGVPLRKFVWWNLLGLLIAVPGMVVLGFIFGAPLAEGALWVVRQGRGVLAFVMLAVAIYAVWRWRTDDAPIEAFDVESDRESSVGRF